MGKTNGRGRRAGRRKRPTNSSTWGPRAFPEIRAPGASSASRGSNGKKTGDAPAPLSCPKKGRGRQLETGGLGAGSHDNIAEIQSHGVAVPLHGPCLWEKPREEGRMSEVRKNNTHPPTQF